MCGRCYHHHFLPAMKILGHREVTSQSVWEDCILNPGDLVPKSALFTVIYAASDQR